MNRVQKQLLTEQPVVGFGWKDAQRFFGLTDENAEKISSLLLSKYKDAIVDIWNDIFPEVTDDYFFGNNCANIIEAVYDRSDLLSEMPKTFEQMAKIISEVGRYNVNSTVSYIKNSMEKYAKNYVEYVFLKRNTYEMYRGYIKSKFDVQIDDDVVEFISIFDKIPALPHKSTEESYYLYITQKIFEYEIENQKHKTIMSENALRVYKTALLWWIRNVVYPYYVLREGARVVVHGNTKFPSLNKDQFGFFTEKELIYIEKTDDILEVANLMNNLTPFDFDKIKIIYELGADLINVLYDYYVKNVLKNSDNYDENTNTIYLINFFKFYLELTNIHNFYAIMDVCLYQKCLEQYCISHYDAIEVISNKLLEMVANAVQQNS